MNAVVVDKTTTGMKAAEKTFVLAVFGYSIVRALPLWGGLAEGGVNPWLFLVIDVGTAWPYARSWPLFIRSVRDRNGGAAMRWAAVLTGTFAAPYLYVAAVGEDVPATVWVALSAFAAIGIVGGIRRMAVALRGGAR